MCCYFSQWSVLTLYSPVNNQFWNDMTVISIMDWSLPCLVLLWAPVGLSDKVHQVCLRRVEKEEAEGLWIFSQVANFTLFSDISLTALRVAAVWSVSCAGCYSVTDLSAAHPQATLSPLPFDLQEGLTMRMRGSPRSEGLIVVLFHE